LADAVRLNDTNRKSLRNKKMKELLLSMKSELVITVIIFILLLVKLGSGMKNATLLSLVQAQAEVPILRLLEGAFHESI